LLWREILSVLYWTASIIHLLLVQKGDTVFSKAVCSTNILEKTNLNKGHHVGTFADKMGRNERHLKN
jgi:hypothetical protein